MMVGLLLLLLLGYTRCTHHNYITNGDFQQPQVGNQFYSKITVVGTAEVAPWQGKFDLMGANHANNNFGYGQYIDLETLSNGWLQQNVTLPYNGIYKLSFYHKAASENYDSFVMQIWWNGKLKVTISPLQQNVLNISMNLQGVVGSNILCFKEVSYIQQSFGTYLDNIQLLLVSILNETTTQNTINITDQTNTTTTQNTTNITGQTNITNTTNTADTTNTTDMINLSQENQIHYQIFIQSVEFITPQNQSEPDNLPIQVQFIQQIWSWINLMPLNQIPVFKYCTILLDDFWLYPYDKRQYDRLLGNILKAIQGIQSVKWQIINEVFKVNFRCPQTLISNYTYFTRAKIMKIQTTDQNIIHSLFPWFTFDLAISTLICIFNLIFFKITYAYCISKIFRRYSFTFFCLIQANVEPNLAYLVYFCFAHMEILFSFTFLDKISMVFAIFVLFTISIFCVTFYAILGKYLKSKAGYFIYCFYRCNGSYAYLTIRFLLRAFIRGAIHFFFVNYETTQKINLCLLEIIVIIFTIYLEKKKEIFIKKTFFCLFLMYHTGYIFLNVYLISQFGIVNQNEHLQLLSCFIEDFLIYCLLGINLLIMIIDFIPNHLMKPLKSSRKINHLKNYDKDNIDRIRQDKPENNNKNSKKRRISDPFPFKHNYNMQDL